MFFPSCTSIAFLMKTMPLKWVIEHQVQFAKSLMFVMMDLTNEVSAGTVDSAKETLEKLIRQCNSQDEKVMYNSKFQSTSVCVSILKSKNLKVVL